MFRKIPTQAELDRAEQSLTRIRADLDSKRRDATSLKMRGASQSEVCSPQYEIYELLSFVLF